MSSWKESMINRLSNLVNRNRSAAKISQVLCSNQYSDLNHFWHLVNFSVERENEKCVSGQLPWRPGDFNSHICRVQSLVIGNNLNKPIILLDW